MRNNKSKCPFVKFVEGNKHSKCPFKRFQAKKLGAKVLVLLVTGFIVLVFPALLHKVASKIYKCSNRSGGCPISWR